VSVNILVTSFCYIYKNKPPVLRKLNLKTMYRQTYKVAANVYSLMVEEVKQRYASSADLNEVKNKSIRIE
jgi:hypothetical protein